MGAASGAPMFSTADSGAPVSCVAASGAPMFSTGASGKSMSCISASGAAVAVAVVAAAAALGAAVDAFCSGFLSLLRITSAASGLPASFSLVERSVITLFHAASRLSASIAPPRASRPAVRWKTPIPPPNTPP